MSRLLVTMVGIHSISPLNHCLFTLPFLQIVITMKIIQKSKQLLVLCPNGIFLFNLSNRTRTHALVNKHDKELTCMTYYKAKDLLITGKKRFWVGINFLLVPRLASGFSGLLRAT